MSLLQNTIYGPSFCNLEPYSVCFTPAVKYCKIYAGVITVILQQLHWFFALMLLYKSNGNFT